MDAMDIEVGAVLRLSVKYIRMLGKVIKVNADKGQCDMWTRFGKIKKVPFFELSVAVPRYPDHIGRKTELYLLRYHIQDERGPIYKCEYNVKSVIVGSPRLQGTAFCYGLRVIATGGIQEFTEDEFFLSAWVDRPPEPRKVDGEE